MYSSQERAAGSAVSLRTHDRFQSAGRRRKLKNSFSGLYLCCTCSSLSFCTISINIHKGVAVSMHANSQGITTFGGKMITDIKGRRLREGGETLAVAPLAHR